jgi:hypothetical protein
MEEENDSPYPTKIRKSIEEKKIEINHINRRRMEIVDQASVFLNATGGKSPTT